MSPAQLQGFALLLRDWHIALLGDQGGASSGDGEPIHELDKFSKRNVLIENRNGLVVDAELLQFNSMQRDSRAGRGDADG